MTEQERALWARLDQARSDRKEALVLPDSPEALADLRNWALALANDQIKAAMAAILKAL